MAAEHRTHRDQLESRMLLSPIDRYLRARIARSEAIAKAIIAAGRGVRALARRALERSRDDRARCELIKLTNRELADIGLSRSDLYRGDLSKLGRGESPRRTVGLVPGGGGSATTIAANQNGAETRTAA